MQIAKVCNVSGETLLAQYQDVCPRAMAVVRQAKDVNKHAWKFIYDKIQEHHLTAKNHPMDVLMPALILSHGSNQNYFSYENYLLKLAGGFCRRNNFFINFLRAKRIEKKGK